MSKNIKNAVDALLESKGIKGKVTTDEYSKISSVLESYLSKVDSGINSLLEADYTTLDQDTVINMIMNADYDFAAKVRNFDALAKSAEETGKNNTVKKGKGADNMANKNDIKNGESKDWDDKCPKCETKADVDKKAESAKEDGVKNTVKKGKTASLAKKGMLESLQNEIKLHDTYIDFVKSFDNGEPERSEFLESVISKFLETHKTLEKIDTLKSIYESEEGVGVVIGEEDEDVKPVNSDTVREQSDKMEELADSVEEVEEKVGELKELTQE